MKSALFVDFDNVFSQLRQLQPDAAERFARHPSDWIEWLTGSLALPEPNTAGQRRRLLVRRCYLNPNWYQTYRHAFLRAGFEIVDSPPVTSQGKTSTDIHMVLDIIELLQHETRYDEFIVFSADADFTPVLRKLRRYDRRTTVLAIGFPSAAYQASSDLMIDERQFVKDALGLDRAPEPADAAEIRSPESRPIGGEATTPQPVPQPTSPRPEPGVRITPRSATPDELLAIAERITTLVDESTLPVVASLLASRLKLEHPEVLEHWNGSGSFRQFFRSLGLSRLLWVQKSGGRVIDPVRHEVDAIALTDDPESPWAGTGAMFDIVKEVCTLTGAPMLAPRDLKRVLKVLADDLRLHGFEINTTVRRVCARCFDDAGLRLRLRDIGFLLRGMQLNGHAFGQGQDDPATLSSRLVNQVLFLCQREQMPLDDAGKAQVTRWIRGDETA